MFASLSIRNFRLFLTGHAISMTGLWTQRIAQDWLVLTLTHNAFVVGLVTAIQCLPTLLFGYWAGIVSDVLPRRQILLATQAAMGLLAAVLAVLTLTGHVRTWHVFVIAALLGLVSVVDNPTRQAFVVDMVGNDRIRNATSLASSVFQLGALVGPAAAGFLIEAVGVGVAFTINAISFVAPIAAVLAMRPNELLRSSGPRDWRAQGAAPIRLILSQRNVLLPLVVSASFGMFLPNLPVTLAASTTTDFHRGSGTYGLLTAVVALGSLCGALYSATRRDNRLRSLLIYAALLTLGYLALSLMPGPLALALALFPVGVLTLLVITGSNALVQLSAPRQYLGRVMGIFILVALGTASLGGPVIGYVDHVAGPRFGYLVAGLVPAVVLTGVVVALAVMGRTAANVRPLTATALRAAQPATTCS